MPNIDKLYIANAALDLVGFGGIVSLDDGSEEARRSKLHIDKSIAEVLEMGYWKCAKTDAKLVAESMKPNDWGYSYLLPVDYLRLYRLNDVEYSSFAEGLFDIRGNKLLTEDSAAEITYIRDLSVNTGDVGLLTPMLADLIAIKQAQKLSWKFTNSRSLRESLLQEFRLKMPKALVKDAFESRPRPTNQYANSTWLHRR